MKPHISRTGHERDTCTACAGSMILEFAALSRLSGDPIFEVGDVRDVACLINCYTGTRYRVSSIINCYTGTRYMVSSITNCYTGTRYMVSSIINCYTSTRYMVSSIINCYTGTRLWFQAFLNPKQCH